MDQSSDSELVTSYRSGATRSLDLLVERYLTPVYRFIYRLVGDSHIAEELTQETFIKIWQYIGRFDPRRSFKTWAFSIARNTTIDYLRKKTPILFSQMETEEMRDFGESIADTHELPTEILEAKERTLELEQHLSKLSPKARSIVLLHDIEEMTFQEIADTVAEPMNTVKSRYRRALAHLRSLLMNQNKS